MFARAALAALALAGLAAAPAGAATVPPGIVVVNDAANTLTSYPLSASDDAPPAPTLSESSSSQTEPVGVALDGTGDAWVTNLLANTVVEYSAAQLAAGGTPTPLVTLSGASLSGPTGLAFDPAGDLWVANLNSSTVVEYTPSELAAGGAQTPAVTLSSDSSNSIDGPYFIAFDAAGNLWVPSNIRSTLVEFTSDQLTSSGAPTPAVTISADSAGLLNGPVSVAFDRAGDLWTTCTGNRSILEYTPSQLTTGAPSPAKTISSGSLTFPTQAAFDSAGDLWVSDFDGPRVVEFDAAQLAAGGSRTPADTIQGNDTGLRSPESLAIEQAPTVSSLSVAGGPTGTTVPVSGTGFYPGSRVDFGGVPAASVKYLSPYQLSAVAPGGSGSVDVTVTSAFGSSTVSPADRFTYSAAPAIPPTVVTANDSGPGAVTSFPLSASGNVSPAATLSDGSGGALNAPIDGTLDAAGDLWLPSWLANSVIEYTRGEIVAGGAQTPALVISSDSAGSLDGPSGAAFDSVGDLWVTDANSNKVVEYAKAQLAANGAPVPAVTLSADASSSLATPDALTFDRHGDLWVTNGENGNSLVEYTPGQLVTGAPTPAVTITSDAAGSLNGSDQAQLDAAGDLWVADFEPFGNAGSIVEFAPGQLSSSGSPTPIDTIAGDATGLSNPWVLVIEQAPTVSGVSPGGGPAGGGTTATISGTGFYPGSTVDFGGVPAASVTDVSPYELTAVAPAGSGTVDVTVSTGQGTSTVSAADQFAYAAVPPAPPTPPPSPSTGSPAPVARIALGAHQLKVTGHFAGVPLSCAVAVCQGTARLTQRVLVTIRHGGRKVRRWETIVLGTAHYTLRAGRHATINVRLSQGTLTGLAHPPQHRAAVRLTVTVNGGATLSRAVELVEPVKPIR
jgi:sugar lactone lactonase YvrE